MYLSLENKINIYFGHVLNFIQDQNLGSSIKCFVY